MVCVYCLLEVDVKMPLYQILYFHIHRMMYMFVYSACAWCSLVLYYSSQYQKKTALHYASEGGHHNTVKVLLERGADPNQSDMVSGVYMYIIHIHMYVVCL